MPLLGAHPSSPAPPATLRRPAVLRCAAGVPLPQQLAVLEYRMDGTVATHDDPPAVLGRMPPSFVEQMGGRLRPGRLLRFRIGPGGVYFAGGQPVRGPGLLHSLFTPGKVCCALPAPGAAVEGQPPQHFLAAGGGEAAHIAAHP